MKITLEFSNEEESRNYLNGPKLFNLAWEFEEWLRQTKKHTESSKEAEVLEKVWKQWFDIRRDQDITTLE